MIITLFCALICSWIALVLIGINKTKQDKVNRTLRQQIYYMNEKLSIIYINQLNQYYNAMLQEEDYEELAKIKVLLEQEKAAVNKFYGLDIK